MDICSTSSESRIRTVLGRIRGNESRLHGKIKYAHREDIDDRQCGSELDQPPVNSKRLPSYIQRLLRDSQRRRRKLFLVVEISFLLSGVLCALSGSAILGRSVSRNRGERADISAWMMVVVCVMTGWFLFCCGASMACGNSPWTWLSVSFSCVA